MAFTVTYSVSAYIPDGSTDVSVDVSNIGVAPTVKDGGIPITFECSSVTYNTAIPLSATHFSNPGGSSWADIITPLSYETTYTYSVTFYGVVYGYGEQSFTSPTYSFTTESEEPDPYVEGTGTLSIICTLSGVVSTISPPPKATNPFPQNKSGNCKNILTYTWELEE